jgi:uncharacterized membrane protein
MAAALLALTFGGLVLLVVGWLALQGKLRRNHVAGIRTPFTMRSDENWYATHRHAAPVLIFAGVAVTAMGLAFLPFAVAGALPDWFVTGASGVMAALVLSAAIGSWLYGTRRARAELDHR